MKDSAVALAIDLIRLDGGTQPRANIDEDTVADYAAVWQSANGSYPFDTPCEVFHDGTNYWCTDGFHRILGAARSKRASVPCIVHKGSQRDAIVYAAKCNSRHGLRRTAADKRYIVAKFLNDDEWKAKSNRWIADVCDVHHSLVSTIKAEIESSNSVGTSANSHPKRGGDKEEKTRGKDGKSYRKTKPSHGNQHTKTKEVDSACSVSKAKHEWVSDGSGQRYCEHCKEDHPENEKEPGPSVHLNGIAKTIEACRVNIDKVVRASGKHALTDDIQSNLDKALIALKKWAKSCTSS